MFLISKSTFVFSDFIFTHITTSFVYNLHAIKWSHLHRAVPRVLTNVDTQVAIIPAEESSHLPLYYQFPDSPASGYHQPIFCHYRLVLPILEFYILNQIIWHIFFSVWFLLLSRMLLHIPVVYSYLLLNSISLYWYITICLFTCW